MPLKNTAYITRKRMDDDLIRQKLLYATEYNIRYKEMFTLFGRHFLFI